MMWSKLVRILMMAHRR